ncbi:MAG: outer membrane beta-barrel protein [Limisphaerales bacterium]
MKFNKWTMTLAAAGVVSLGSVVQAEEAQHQVLTALSSTTLSGYVDTSAIWKPGTGNGFIPGRAFDGGVGNPGGNKLDGFNFNVAEISLSKPLDEGQWSAGYTVNLLFGPDANGYNTSPVGGGFGGASSDFGVKDAYITLRAPVGNGLDIKIGTFATVLGYEVFEAGNNPNYSRSYGWQLEPTQNTGVLLGYRLNDMISVAAGVLNTYNAGINARPTRGFVPATESEKTYTASITFTAPESAGVMKGSTLTLAAINGLNGGFGSNTERTTSLYAGVTVPTPVEGLSAGAAFDYRSDGANGVTVGNNWAWAGAGYISYQCSEKLKINARADYTDGSDGTWIPFMTGQQNNLCAGTITVDYSLWSNVITRAEARWDHSLNGNRPFSNSMGAAGNKNAVTLALNVIYKF